VSAIHTLKTGAGGDKVEDVVESPDELRLAVRRKTICFQVSMPFSPPTHHRASIKPIEQWTTRSNNTVAGCRGLRPAQPLAIRRLLDVPFEGSFDSRKSR
jgi:hypothetical protein